MRDNEGTRLSIYIIEYDCSSSRIRKEAIECMLKCVYISLSLLGFSCFVKAEIVFELDAKLDF